MKKVKMIFMIHMMNVGGVEKSLLSLLSVIPKDEYDVTIYMLEKKGGFLKFLPDWVTVEVAEWFPKIEPLIMQPPQQTLKGYLRQKRWVRVVGFVYAYFVTKWWGDRSSIYKHLSKDIPKNANEYDVAIAYQGPMEVIDFYVTHKINANQKFSWVHFDVSKFGINQGLFSRLYLLYDKIYVVSKEAKEKLLEQIPDIQDKVDVANHIIAYHHIKALAKDTVILDPDYKGFKIVTVGRLSKEKGQDLAIQALSLLRRDGYDVRWYCIGEGNQRSDCEALIHELGLTQDFVLLGEKTNPYPYIALADIYVQTSRHEGFCLTLAEAICLAKPIVTTNFAAAFEQITDSQTGYIVNCDAIELSKKIKYLIDHPVERERLKNNLTSESKKMIQVGLPRNFATEISI